MKLFHYLEIKNFKCFGDQQRIELDHPAVFIGPNNCGKTTALQAIALWSQAIKTWFDAKGKAPPKARTATSLNRLQLVSVPVQRTRFFWHNTVVRRGNTSIWMEITIGMSHDHKVEPVTMRFRYQNKEVIYCTPDVNTLAKRELIETAARLSVHLLYPMSGLETEEPILQQGRIDVLLGQGQTAQALRNLCLLVFNNAPANWRRIASLIERLFAVKLDDPQETTRGSINLNYRQTDVKEKLGIALAGRGLQQILLILAYLYSHRGSVLLIDEPDAHLEILRQKQIYVLLRDIASENESQVILVTHSEIILEESLEQNLTLLLDGQADDLARRSDIRNALRHYGTEHYIRARQRGYVLYVEGRTDLDILRALAKRLNHPVAISWDQQINAYFVQDNFPNQTLDSEIERVEGGYGMTPRSHFSSLRDMVPGIKGLVILDNDSHQRADTNEGELTIRYWHRYEIENYFITPAVLRDYALEEYSNMPRVAQSIDAVLNALMQERVFSNKAADFETWQQLDDNAKRLLWEQGTRHIKLSDFGETFFRRLAEQLGHAMLLRKGDLYRLVDFVNPASISEEVGETLDLLQDLFDGGRS